ncbi:phosphatidylinositol glycan, class Q [Cladophialophora psammophila CBS 110553]|uniref:Phosphatidylinositol glycan, class Q n=1 Tax=Cladophialophora psammophila CBS 110553 TaxID=1182543 RepID=W9WGR6_9EURO|nr:phosphatidylinositol glycan, class Q [Cladophialophora psammophila CBS 110553]EXJ67113.1 phosphatidylinositol glycan, class Q [Cladophialophora psammophila CBS 110553]
MVENSDGMLRVFWPSTLTRTTTPGVIVGWRNSEYDLFVITVLEDVEVRSVESALRMGTLFRNSPYPVARIFQLCDQPHMHVLGTFNHPDPPEIFNPSKICAFTMSGSRRPSIYCPPGADLTVQIVLFDPPNPTQMQYMSLEPISLALGRDHLPAGAPDSTLDEVGMQGEKERQRVADLVAKLRFHTVIRHAPTKKELALPAILRQINCAQEVADLLQKNTPLVGPRRKRSLSVSERVVESAQSLYAFAAWSLWTLFMAYAFPTLLSIFKIAIIGHRIIAEGLLRLLELPLPFQKLQLPESRQAVKGTVALKDISACCQQVHLRLQQFSYYPTQYSLLRRRKATWSSFPTTNSDYIRFYNSLWLVANDVIIGIALGSFISDNAQATSQLIGGVLNEYTIEGLKRMIRWLMSYPGGLKLNTELAAFLGDLFLWVIEYWSSTIVVLIVPRLPTVVYVVGCSSFAGATMPIAIFSDLLSLLTMHIYSFYVASARIFNWQLTIIISLFHLFRGKKRNVLRNRIDNCDYDLDQLLLGTILFTLLFFLLPTVVVFYLTFASARMAIISLKATLDTCLACLNHFPLFALMLRIKDSKRLPGGIHFQLLDAEQTRISYREETEREDDRDGSAGDIEEQGEGEEDNGATSVAYIRLSSTPLSLRQIFEQYFQLWARIRRHYLSPTVVFRLLTGRFVPPLGRSQMYGLQYSVLPRQRATIAEVWKSLSENEFPSTGDVAPANPRGQKVYLGAYGKAIGKQWK